jgi:ribosomal protein S18 acetylase RimI-like enzyme
MYQSFQTSSSNDNVGDYNHDENLKLPSMIGEMIGTIVCKADDERDCMKGYIAMLAVNKSYRKRGIGLKVNIYLIPLYILLPQLIV